MRKVASWATITYKNTHIKDGNGCTVLTVAKSATGGIPGETQVHTLDGVEHVYESILFGTRRVETRWLDLRSKDPISGVVRREDLDPYLSQDLLDQEAGDSPGHIWAAVTNERSGMRGEQVWGFELIAGKRYHVNRMVLRKGEERVDLRIVFDWAGNQ